MRQTTVLLGIMLILSSCGSEDLGSAPDVRGLALPEAKQELKREGYRSSVKSDALFGVIIEENLTVRKQESPNGSLVPLEVSKQC